jgi:transglutaminase-like putative cysteine protease
MTRYQVTHRTIYRYSAPVSHCHNKAHLILRDHLFQKSLEPQIRITPTPSVNSRRVDFFGNTVLFFTVQTPHAELEVEVKTEVDVTNRIYPKPSATMPWDQIRRLVHSDLTIQGLEAYEFVFDSPHVHRSEDLYRYAEPSFPPGRPLLEAVLDLTARIHRDFQYAPATTSVSTPIAEVLKTRKGVCQDFAHLQIGCLRSMGLPARYVSGYLRTTPPPGKPRLVGADASHAWLSIYHPGNGWFDVDPTNDSMPKGSHITLALGRDYSDVSPIRGIITGGGYQGISVSVDVCPIT